MEDENSITEEINKALRAAVWIWLSFYDCWFFFKNKGVQFMLHM
jgi:hypothetical protein